jgi:hypothetical protein
MGSPYLVRALWVRPLLASLVSTTLASPRAADEDDRLMVVTSPLACKAVLGVCSARMTPRVAKMRLLASMTFYECLKETAKVHSVDPSRAWDYPPIHGGYSLAIESPAR